MAKTSTHSTGRPPAPPRIVPANHKRLMRQLAGVEKHLETHKKDSVNQNRASAIKTQLSA